MYMYNVSCNNANTSLPQPCYITVEIVTALDIKLYTLEYFTYRVTDMAFWKKFFIVYMQSSA